MSWAKREHLAHQDHDIPNPYNLLATALLLQVFQTPSHEQLWCSHTRLERLDTAREADLILALDQRRRSECKAHLQAGLGAVTTVSHANANDISLVKCSNAGQLSWFPSALVVPTSMIPRRQLVCLAHFPNVLSQVHSPNSN